MLACLDEWLADFHRRSHDFGDFKRLKLQFDFASGDAGNVQQIVHQPGEMLDLPLNNPLRPFQPLGLQPILAQ